MKKKRKPKPINWNTSFDGIANKFDQNIYGTSKGKLRHLLLLEYLEGYLHNDKSLHVLDAGGGTGMMANEFARHGHYVTLWDQSEDALTIARQRLGNYQNVVIKNVKIQDAIHSDKSTDDTSENSNDLENHKHFDLIVCHALLEWLDKPLDMLDKLLEMLTPQTGVLSLSFFNRDAMLFNNVLYGNFEYVSSGMNVRNRVRLSPHNPQSPLSVLEHIQQNSNVTLIHHAGIRCFHDYMLDKSKIDSQFDDLFQLELAHGKQHPFKWIGKYCHMLIKRTH